MKRVFLLLLVFISCQNQVEKEITTKNLSDKLHENATKVYGGKPPTDNPILKELLTSNDKDLNRVDSIYKSNIEIGKGFDYYENLKQYGFKLVMKHGLVEDGTSEQKKYYINEQISLSNNIPNFDQFYLLLKSSSTFLSKKELIDIGDMFYNKNKEYIEMIEWPDINSKQNKLNDLYNKYDLFIKNI